MRWGGVQKTSLIDYPGRVSAVFFAMGCNFDCPYCHNPQLVRGDVSSPQWLDDDWCMAFLSERVGLLDGVVISGGEPTLQPGLGDFCRRVKALGLPVKLDTNGSRPRVVERLVRDCLIDFIAMDVKTVPDDYDPVCRVQGVGDAVIETIRLIKASGIPHEFRTTCVKPLVDADVIRAVSELIRGCQVYALQRFQEKRVLHPEYFKTHQAGYTPGDLEKFRVIAASAARRCIVR